MVVTVVDYDRIGYSEPIGKFFLLESINTVLLYY